MAGRKATPVQNPLAGLAALAQLGDLVGALSSLSNPTPAAAPTRAPFTGGREGYRSVAVVSVEEAAAIVKAAKEGTEQKIVVNGRETVIEVLDAESAVKFKGGFRIHRRPLPTA